MLSMRSFALSNGKSPYPTRSPAREAARTCFVPHQNYIVSKKLIKKYPPYQRSNLESSAIFPYNIYNAGCK